MMLKKRLVELIGQLLFVGCCFLFSMQLNAQNFPDETWEKINYPTFTGWDIEGLQELESYVIDSTVITGMVIIHNGKIVYEYGNISENSYIASCRKSVLAMLYGKYVMDGTINLDKSLKELGLAKSEQLLEIESKATIRDIISARSGIFLPASNRGDFLHLAPERGSVTPGEFWLYSNYDFNMAGHLFEKESKRNIYDEIQSQFAIPLQMQDWDRSLQEKSGDPTVSDHMAYHMWFSARDMARLGLLMLNQGKWNDKQVIHADWVKEMTTPKTSFEELDAIAPFMKDEVAQYGYGYMWWLWDQPNNERLKGAYSALGAWGQNITVLPEMNTVLAIKTNDKYGRRKGNHNRIVDRITKIYNEANNAKLKSLSKSLEQENIDQFLSDFVKMNPEDSNMEVENVLNNMGYEYLFNGNHETALKIFNQNVKSHPDSWNLYDSLGEGYFTNEDYGQALKYYKKAIELNPDNVGGNNDRVGHIIKRIELKMK